MRRVEIWIEVLELLGTCKPEGGARHHLTNSSRNSTIHTPLLQCLKSATRCTTISETTELDIVHDDTVFVFKRTFFHWSLHCSWIRWKVFNDHLHEKDKHYWLEIISRPAPRWTFARRGRTVEAQVRLSWSIYQEGTTSSGRHQIIHCTRAKPNLRCNPGLLQFSQFSFAHIFTHRPPSPARNGQCPSKVNRRPCEECRQG